MTDDVCRISRRFGHTFTRVGPNHGALKTFSCTSSWQYSLAFSAPAPGLCSPTTSKSFGAFAPFHSGSSLSYSPAHFGLLHRVQKTLGPEKNDDLKKQVGWLTGWLFIAALTSTVLPCLPPLWHWRLFFFLEYAFLECMTSWGFLSPFVNDIRDILKDFRRRVGIRLGKNLPDVESVSTTVRFNNGYDCYYSISIIVF